MARLISSTTQILRLSESLVSGYTTVLRIVGQRASFTADKDVYGATEAGLLTGPVLRHNRLGQFDGHFAPHSWALLTGSSPLRWTTGNCEDELGEFEDQPPSKYDLTDHVCTTASPHSQGSPAPSRQFGLREGFDDVPGDYRFEDLLGLIVPADNGRKDHPHIDNTMGWAGTRTNSGQERDSGISPNGQGKVNPYFLRSRNCSAVLSLGSVV